MAIFYSDKAQGLTPGASAAAGAPQGTTPAISVFGANEVAAVEAKVSLTTALAANDTAVMCLLPAGHVPVDLLATFDDLDNGGTAITVTACVLDDTLAAAVASTNFFTTSTAAQAGGVARASVVDGLRLAASALDRWIGFIFPAAATTPAAGTATLVLTYRASNGD